jgi:pimeloyl-ACP methyl ester carboxylesterase
MSSIPRSGELFAKTNGIELCYQTFGQDDAEPLILIMGLSAQMVLWEEEFCERIAGQGFRVVRFDNRDIGRSTKFSGGGRVTLFQFLGARFLGRSIPSVYLLKDMAADVFGLMDSLGMASAHVVGASMGGMIAQEMALARPDRLRTLTAIMSSTSGPGLPAPSMKARAVLMRSPPRSKEEYIGNYRATWSVLRNGSFPEEEARDPFRAERNWTRGLNPAGSGRQFTAVLASGSRRERLAAVRTPTLVIHGARDPLVPIAHGRDIQRSVRGAKLLEIPNMGHAIAERHWPEIIGGIVEHARSA